MCKSAITKVLPLKKNCRIHRSKLWKQPVHVMTTNNEKYDQYKLLFRGLHPRQKYNLGTRWFHHLSLKKAENERNHQLSFDVGGFFCSNCLRSLHFPLPRLRSYVVTKIQKKIFSVVDAFWEARSKPKWLVIFACLWSTISLFMGFRLWRYLSCFWNAFHKRFRVYAHGFPPVLAFRSLS